MKNSFKKTERLKSRKLIDQLFKQGSTSLNYPFKFVWLYSKEPLSARSMVMIGSSKKTLKKATDRNKMKRRIKEAYRRNKNVFLDSLEKTDSYCALGIIHVGKEISAFKETEKKIIDLLNRLIEDNENNSG